MKDEERVIYRLVKEAGNTGELRTPLSSDVL